MNCLQLQTPIVIAVKKEKWNYADVLVEVLGGKVRSHILLFTFCALGFCSSMHGSIL